MEQMNDCILDARKMIVKIAVQQRQSFYRENRVLVEYCNMPTDAVTLAKNYNLRYCFCKIDNTIDEDGVKAVLRRRHLGFTKKDEQLQIEVMKQASVLILGLQRGGADPVALRDIKNSLNNHPEKRRLLFLSVTSGCGDIARAEAYQQALRLNADFASKCLAKLFEILERAGDLSAQTKEIIALKEENTRLSQRLSQRTKQVLHMRDEYEVRMQKNCAEAELQLIKRLNDEKHGCILDLLHETRRIFQRMQKENQDVPFELKSAQTLARRLLEFVEACNITSMLEVDTTIPLTMQEVDQYRFEGKPFADEAEVKQVRIVSPGWQWNADETEVISYPLVREEL